MSAPASCSLLPLPRLSLLHVLLCMPYGFWFSWILILVLGLLFFFWFAIWFVWHLVQISFICGFGVNVPQQMHFWYAYISVCQCVWGCVCVRVCVPVCKQIWALTCALLVLSDTDTATCCSRIQSALWFLSCYKFHRLTWQLSIVAWQVTMTPAGIRYS